MDGWVHVHKTMIGGGDKKAGGGFFLVVMVMMMMIFQMKRKIHNKRVIIHYTVQCRNIFGRVHNFKSHIGRADRPM